MFFFLSKIAGFFAHPSNLIAVLIMIGSILLATRFRRAGFRIVMAGVVALLLFGYSPLSNLLLLPLSERFPAWQENSRAPDGIVVLGGAIDSDSTVTRGSLEMDASAERVFAMLRLARKYPNAKIVFSGGSGSIVQGREPEAPIAGALLAEFGIVPDRVVLEGKSRTTWENAVFTRDLVQRKPNERWILVTSAFHMPRSIGAFRRAGFDIEAYPVDWRTGGWRDAGSNFDRLSAGLARVDVALHEWIGLVAYWLTDRSSALFPKPQ